MWILENYSCSLYRDLNQTRRQLPLSGNKYVSKTNEKWSKNYLKLKKDVMAICLWLKSVNLWIHWSSNLMRCFLPLFGKICRMHLAKNSKNWLQKQLKHSWKKILSASFFFFEKLITFVNINQKHPSEANCLKTYAMENSFAK